LKLSVLIPVYNEERTVADLITKVLEIKGQGNVSELEIIAVDDCSTDETLSVLRELEDKGKISLLIHKKNMGKGAAVRTAIKAAKGDYTIFQDADLEYDPMDIVRMCEKSQTEKLDVLYGSRFLENPSSPLGRFHYLVNAGLTTLSNFFTGLKLTDMETCYKMFRTSVIQKIDIEENRFGLEPEITAKISSLIKKDRLKIAEMPISYSPRKQDEGKKIGFSDGVRAIYIIFKYGILK